MNDGREDIYQSNTNLNPRDMYDYLDLATKYGYQVKIILPESENILLYENEIPYQEQKNVVISNRSGNIPGQKSIPEPAMRAMINTFERNIPIMRKIKEELDSIDKEDVSSEWKRKIEENIISPIRFR